jgi:hypothetical protein
MKTLIIVTAVLLGVFSHLPTFAEEKEKPWGMARTDFDGVWNKRNERHEVAGC